MENNKINTDIENNQNGINIAEFLFNILKQWRLFVACILVALLVAFAITKYSTPLYETQASLLIKSSEDKMSAISDILIQQQTLSNQSFQNEIGTIQSFTMVKNTVKALKFYVSYYLTTGLKTSDIYTKSPFEVELDLTQPQPTGIPIEIKLNKNTCLISYASKTNVAVYAYDTISEGVLDEKISVDGVTNKMLNYDQWYVADGMKFKIRLTEPYYPTMSKMDYSFIINDLDAEAKALMGTQIELLQKDATIIKIKFRHQNPQKAMDFVNKLCNIYINETYTEKTHVNNATIDFVNTEMGFMKDSLLQSENARKAFQEKTGNIDFGGVAEVIYSKLNSIDDQKAQLYVNQQYYDNLIKYINNSSLDSIVVPATMGIEESVLGHLVESLIKVHGQRKKMLVKSSSSNPQVQKLDVEISTIQSQIKENVKNIKQVSQITLNNLKRQEAYYNVEANKLPESQRQQINIERQFRFTEGIYTYLYQKRADAQIAAKSAVPDHKIIDKAREAEKVYPRTTTNFLISFLVGLLLPAIYIFMKMNLKTTIDSKDDLDKVIHNASVLGYIPLLPDEANKMVVFDKPKSQVAESFRAVRTNIKYIAEEKEDEGQIILITSSLPGEGKSFIALNMASVFSYSGKKTLIMGYDLRKPNLHNIFTNITRQKGITTYLIGKDSIDDIIQHTEFDNLDVVVSGPVPPNPSELIDSAKNFTLLSEMRKKYDYIILDTPPTSLIADAATMMQWTDINMFVIRATQTNKNVLKLTFAELLQQDHKINFVINGVENFMQKYGYSYGNRYGYGYGYGYGGYGYGYGYGYFEDDVVNDNKTKRKKRRNKYF
ncbi:MAG: polysaccharide biosynthesis tyrosine autokinase [Bacteroidales bacterium]|jgi:capsular exopolysaccharide synthesis family protein|nr:polysaccharide biosynthesis tyrosine autokinase [Bacteroidales bacterium]